jgi:leucyl aminopeptidase
MPPQIVSSGENPLEVACDALVVGVSGRENGLELSGTAGEIDAALDGLLSEYLRSASFKAKVGDVTCVPTLGRLPSREIAAVGLGKNVDSAAVRRAAGAAARQLYERPTLASTLHSSAGDGGPAAAAEGYLLGSYRFVTYKSDPRPSKIQRILFLEGAPSDALERGQAIAEATALARDLTNEPASTLTPDALARRAKDVADVGGLECIVMDEKELADKGFGGLLGVSKGSRQPPRLIRLHYSPQNARGHVILVGKGVTYDSGGLSIKDARSMETMKTDMAGAAAVLGTMSALSRLGPSLEVTGIIPTTENMPGGDATRPGDVLTHYGGRTTEVNNTDAEGRLILGDALAYASESNPDAIVDLATLTGGIMIALGNKSTGVFSNNDALVAEMQSAADAAGERIWRMPIYDDYYKELDSEVADMKNSGSRYGSSIIATLFLKKFVGEGIPWAHLDIAGTARSDSNYDEISKGGTGVGVRTLLRWIEERSR